MSEHGKELLKLFKAPPWKVRAEFDAFLRQLPSTPLDASEIVEILAILGSRRAASEVRNHGLRLQLFSRLAPLVIDRTLFSHYVNALKEADPPLRALLAQLLPAVNAVEEHARLCQLLTSPDPALRAVVAKVLAQVGERTVVQLLTQAAEQTQFVGRSEAIEVLSQLAGPQAVALLEKAVVHGDVEDRVKALRWLVEPQRVAGAVQAALQVIARALTDPDELVVIQAVASFGQLCDEESYFDTLAPYLEHGSVPVMKAAVACLRRFDSPRSIAALERRLRAGPHAVCLEALQVLEAIGNDKVLPTLVAALAHRRPAVRNVAGEILQRLSQAGRLDTACIVVWLARSRDENVRRMAIELARTTDQGTGQLWLRIFDLLREQDWWARERVTEVLIEVAGQQLTSYAVTMLADPQDVLRRNAVDILLRLRDKRALSALAKTAQDDPDWWVRECAVAALAQFGDQRVVPHLVRFMQGDASLRVCCLEALLTLQARATAPQVAALLACDDSDVVLAALACLDSFEAAEWVAQLQPLLAHPVATVAQRASDLITRWQAAPAAGSFEQHGPTISGLDALLTGALERGGEDTILASAHRPYVKCLGRVELLGTAILAHAEVQGLLLPLLSAEQLRDLDARKEVDFSYEVRGRAQRFRVNLFLQQGGLGAVFRAIRTTLPDLSQLGLPAVVKGFGDLRDGLVLVGGPTGSGKSTTLAALIHHINATSDRHIISLEDPIEVLHPSLLGLVNQRELGTHAKSFGRALRATLREDPDVILVGELRDLETIAFAITAAETGHLVFGTVHTVTADATMERLVNAFPACEQDQVRATLAENLRAVVCQYLIKRANGQGRVLAAEVMINNNAVANLIRKAKSYQIPSVIATMREAGMQLMDQELMRLAKEGTIAAEEAYLRAVSKKEFEALVAGAGGREEGAPAQVEVGATRPSAHSAARPVPAAVAAAAPGQRSASQVGVVRPAARTATQPMADPQAVLHSYLQGHAVDRSEG